MNNKANEWQELSLKKDIEKILRFLKEQKTTEYIITFEIALTFFSIFVDVSQNKILKKCICFIFISFIVIVIILIHNCCRTLLNTIKNKYKTYNSYSKNELVDLFDNDICYCIMTANSYREMLESISSEDTSDKELKKFYYIETWYYINKVKYQFQRMIHKEYDIFTTDSKQVVNKNMISLSRLLNIINLIESIQINIENTKCQELFNEKEYEELKKINIDYDVNYHDFINGITETFDIKIDLTKVR